MASSNQLICVVAGVPVLRFLFIEHEKITSFNTLHTISFPNPSVPVIASVHKSD